MGKAAHCFTFFVFLIDGSEIVDIIQKDCHLHHTIEARVGCLQNGPHVRQGHLSLGGRAPSHHFEGVFVETQATGNVDGAISDNSLTASGISLVVMGHTTMTYSTYL